jgi:hypothetical protein
MGCTKEAVFREDHVEIGKENFAPPLEVNGWKVTRGKGETWLLTKESETQMMKKVGESFVFPEMSKEEAQMMMSKRFRLNGSEVHFG